MQRWLTRSTLASDVDMPNKLSSGSQAVIATQTCDAATTDKADRFTRCIVSSREKRDRSAQRRYTKGRWNIPSPRAA